VEALDSDVVKFEDISETKKIPMNKIIVRSAIGLQSPNLWINSLNIGNVMNLNPMSSDELNLKQEIDLIVSVETILENCILFISSIFCVSTEMRFLYEQQNKINSQLIEQARKLHARAVYFALAFMPD